MRENQRKKNVKKIKWKSLFIKAIEDALKKSVELIILALLLGIAIKIILMTVPAVTIATIISKIVKIKLFE